MHFPMLEPAGRIWATVAMIDSEMQHGRDRVGPIVDRLTEILFLQLINHYVERNRGTTGFLAALRDRRVQRALTLIHQQPDFDWSLAALSEKNRHVASNTCSSLPRCGRHGANGLHLKLATHESL